MPTLREFAGVLNMPVEDMIKIGEQQAVNPNSQIFKSIKLSIANKLAAARAISDADGRVRAKNRLYIHDTVSASDRYTLLSAVPNYDLKFTGTALRSAPLARAANQIVTEVLLDKIKAKRGKVIAWGISMKPILMRSRHWVHLCVPGHDMRTQHDYYMEDRDVSAIVNASISKGRDTGLAKKYLEGTQRVHCVRPHLCVVKAQAGVMLLNTTDTNFRQIAYYMLQHSTELLYIAVPCSKHMELGTEGQLPELGAYVVPSDDGTRVDLVYKNDSQLNFSFDYSNYLELIARTEVTLGDTIFRKEFDMKILGYAIYKITAFPAGQITSVVPAYRSWVEPDHEKQYMVYAPVLRPNGTVSDRCSWELLAFSVPRSIIDDVYDAAMRTQGAKDLAGVIQRRLNSKTSSVVVLNQIVQRNNVMAVTRFELVALVIYCKVFMKKFLDGQAMTALAPHARQVAQLPKQGVLAMLSTYLQSQLHLATDNLSQYLTILRQMYYSVDATDDLPLPSFVLEPGYVEYSEFASANPKFTGWRTPDGDPTYGFTDKLPGSAFKALLPYSDVLSEVWSDEESLHSVDPLMVVHGDAYVDTYAFTSNVAATSSRKAVMKYAATSGSVWQYASMAVSVANAVFHDVPDFESVSSDGSVVRFGGQTEGDLYDSNLRFDSSREVDVPMKSRFLSSQQAVQEVVRKVLADNSNLVALPIDYVTTSVFSSNQVPDVIKGFFSDSPALDIKDAINGIFPGSLLMNTMFFEADKLYGDAEHNIKTVKMKIDLSKLLPLKPEAFYLPILRAHVLPDAKNNMTNVIRTMEKRNANTPDNTIPMDEGRVISAAWEAYLQVYCKPGTAQVLHDMPYIGPDDRVVTEWVSRLDESKRNRLVTQDGYALTDIDLSRNFLMLKGKIKPNLGASYMTSLKMPQSIQYDPSGKSTAVLSPVIGHKVEREQSVLKSNVLVLQRKSVDDICVFLNGFDCRPNEKGERRYLEGDYESYDKSQGIVASKLHWHKCSRFGVLPELVQFLTQQNLMRSISAVESGIKMFIDAQRGSGHPDTLDANNDVNEMVMAELLLGIIDKVEFIILMGDDFIVAVRGIIDISGWEMEISRRYNLTIKLSLQIHGYICSYDIVHYPDGHTTVVADVIKRALAFASVSAKNQDLFAERFISYVDGMKYVDDIRVQSYLSSAIPRRVGQYLPNITSEHVMLLCKAHSKLKTDFSLFRAMFAGEATMRYY